MVMEVSTKGMPLSLSMSFRRIVPFIYRTNNNNLKLLVTTYLEVCNIIIKGQENSLKMEFNFDS